MDNASQRIEKDSLGEIAVAREALWGAQTQRAINNFQLSGLILPPELIEAIVTIKECAALANKELGNLLGDIADAICIACNGLKSGKHQDQFPVDVFQTGSGTSTNMNVNEVVATLATKTLGNPVHPNDHVNRSQSSNDVIPSAIRVSAVLGVRNRLIPALDHLATEIRIKAEEYSNETKTGRTHLMDAMPITFGQAFGAWATQIERSIERIDYAASDCLQLPQGGTAVGTGVNASPEFVDVFFQHLRRISGTGFEPSPNNFADMGSQDAVVMLSGALKTCAVATMKIANDLRWMNSGPVSGLGEITLPVLQPGSSIMPGKVNPVIPESAAMACTQVIGNDVTVTVAGQSGNFELNVMLPVIAYNVLQSIELLTNTSNALAENAIAGLIVNRDKLREQLARNPILVTALNPIIGYDKAAQIAKKAYETGVSIIEVASKETDIEMAELTRLLDPKRLT